MSQTKILIVEDEPTVLGLAELVIRGLGHQVLTATTGQEGIDAFVNSGGGIRVLITDVLMLGMNGLEMAKAIKALQEDISVIFMSGYALTDEITEFVLKWDAQFISKPFNLQHLQSAVNRALSRPSHF